MQYLVNYPSLTQGALHLEGAGMFTMPQAFGNIARMPMFDFLGNLKHQTLCNLHGNMYVEIPYKFSAIPPLPNGRGLLAEVSR